MWGVKKVRTYPWCKMRGVVSQICKKFSLNQPRTLKLLVTDGHPTEKDCLKQTPQRRQQIWWGHYFCFFLSCRNQCALWESGGVWCKICGLKKHLDTFAHFLKMNFHSEWHIKVSESAIDKYPIIYKYLRPSTLFPIQPQKRFNMF